MASAPLGLSIGPLRRSEVPALLAAWNDAFGGGAGFRPRSEADWEARFGRSPHGLRSMVARAEALDAGDGPGGVMGEGGRILCQYAAQAQPARLHGETVSFAQVVDTFVVPDLRRGLAGARLFLRTARSFFEAHGAPTLPGSGAGSAAGRDVLYYGWPVRGVRRLGTAQLGYTLTDRLLLLGREPGSGPGGAVDGVRSWAPCSSGFPHAPHAPQDMGATGAPVVAALYEAASANWGASILRDDAWLSRRFLERDPEAYRLLHVGDHQAPVGLAVLRFGAWPLPHTLALVDWLVPPGEAEAGALLREAILRLGRDLQADALVAHLPPWSPWFACFQEAGWRVHASDLFLVTRPFLRRLEPLWLRDHLWLQLSDTDLV